MNNAKKPISGKGFYAVLFASVAMIGAAGFFAYNRTAKELGNQLSSIESDTPDETRDVGAAVTDVPKTDYTTVFTSVTTTASETVTTIDLEPASKQTAAQPYNMPVEGGIILPFSEGELIKSTTTGAWQTHNGVDIAAPEGAKVSAMTDGEVICVETDALWGVCVEIDHGEGLVSRYCNLSSDVAVAQGDKVVAGQLIGTVGCSADAENLQDSHLHFEVLSDDCYVNPIDVINAYSD